MKLKLFFAWYDLWIGAYWDRKNRVLYICPLPMCVLSVQFLAEREGENEQISEKHKTERTRSLLKEAVIGMTPGRAIMWRAEAAKIVITEGDDHEDLICADWEE